MNLPFFIARRYLISKKSHNAINIISSVSVMGVCIGTMALIIVLSAFNGLSDLVQSLYNSFDPDIAITIKQGKTFDPDSFEIQSLKKLNGIAYYNEVMQGNALLKFNDKQCIATIKGVGKEFKKMTSFDTLIRDGIYSLEKSNIVVGRGICNILQTGPKELFTPISIYAPKRGNNNSINPEDGMNELRVFVSGAFTINDEFDNNYVIMNIDNARKLLDYKNEVTSIELKLKPDADREKVQQQLISILGNKYVVKNREEQNAMLYKTLKSEKLWTFLILIFILIIATFNVIGSLTMLIIEKKKDITILNNMGADVTLIRRIFLLEGLMITLLGAFLGLLLGLFVCWLQVQFKLVRMSEGWLVDAYPMKIHIGDIALIISIVLLIGFAAAWYPVRFFTKKHLLRIA